MSFSLAGILNTANAINNGQSQINAWNAKYSEDPETKKISGIRDHCANKLKLLNLAKVFIGIVLPLAIILLLIYFEVKLTITAGGISFNPYFYLVLSLVSGLIYTYKLSWDQASLLMKINNSNIITKDNCGF